MYPVLFNVGNVTVYSYGCMIAIGVIAGVLYMAVQGKKDTGLTFDQANLLFLYIFIAAFIGGKVFLFFEDPLLYIDSPIRIFSGSGFVFYGSFLFAVPVMLWFFHKYKLDTYRMLDVMAITTCLVHIFGRIGCFMAGCCHGKPTDVFCAVTFSNTQCSAEPKGIPLHPSQLYEAGSILVIMCVLLLVRNRRKFYGQLFLGYLLLYGIIRFILEYFRGDVGRGFIIEGYLSHSQLIAVLILIVVAFVYHRWSKQNLIARKAII